MVFGFIFVRNYPIKTQYQLYPVFNTSCFLLVNYFKNIFGKLYNLRYIVTKIFLIFINIYIILTL